MRLRSVASALSIALVGAVTIFSGAAYAGPPYMTDDPAPTEEGHWEVFDYLETATTAHNSLEGEGGFDINYGVAEDIQLTLVLPVEFQNEHGLRTEPGAVEFGVKYRLLHQSEGGWLPEVAFFPSVSTAVSGDDRHTGYLLPLWLAKDVGDWSFFGGGGYEINPGAGARNAWLGGLAISRAISESASLGIEVYRHTQDADDGQDHTTINLGGTYQLMPNWSLLGAVGTGVENAREEGRYNAYLALKSDY